MRQPAGSSGFSRARGLPAAAGRGWLSQRTRATNAQNPRQQWRPPSASRPARASSRSPRSTSSASLTKGNGAISHVKRARRLEPKSSHPYDLTPSLCTVYAPRAVREPQCSCRRARTPSAFARSRLTPTVSCAPRRATTSSLRSGRPRPGRCCAHCAFFAAKVTH
jgi:hypothetical protein